MILDIIIVAIVAAAVIIGYKRGLAKTLFGFASTLVSIVGAYLAARFLANLIYKSYILTAISESVVNSLSRTVTTSSEVASDVLKNLPWFASGALGLFGINDKSLSSAVDVRSTANAITSAINAVLAPLLISVMTVVFIFILFILFKLLIRLLGKLILKLFELPVIRWVNKLFGGAFGLCEGLLLIYAGILILKIIYPFIENPLISTELINSSFLFKSIYNLGFTTTISDVINSGIL